MSRKAGLVVALLLATATVGCGTTVPQTQQVAGISQQPGTATTGGLSSGDGTLTPADDGTTDQTTGTSGGGAIAGPASASTSIAAGAGTSGATPVIGATPGAVGEAGATTARTGKPTTTTKAKTTTSQASSAAKKTATAQPTATASLANLKPAAGAPGVTATTISIGVYTEQEFSGTAASSFGLNVATGDQEAEAMAAITYINAHGGVAGRQIVPVIHDASVTAAGTSSEAQAACTAFTQDNHVYAVISPLGGVDSSFYSCLAQAGVITIDSGESLGSSFFNQYANTFYEPTDLSVDRTLANEADGFFAAGWFGVAPKIGVVIGDTPSEHAAVTASLVPALAKHGLKLTDTAAITPGTSGTADIQAAVLQFATDGITNVLFTFQGDALLFLESAETQQYRPKYGFNSRNSPGAVLEGSAPADEQTGAIALGWQPDNDVDASHDPGPVSARDSLCLQLLQGAGQDTSSRSTALLGTWLCDDFFYLHDVLDAAQNLSLAGFRTGAESLSAYESASTFRSGLAPGRTHDGVSAYRLLNYVGSCSCYQYTSPITPAE